MADRNISQFFSPSLLNHIAMRILGYLDLIDIFRMDEVCQATRNFLIENRTLYHIMEKEPKLQRLCFKLKAILKRTKGDSFTNEELHRLTKNFYLSTPGLRKSIIKAWKMTDVVLMRADRDSTVQAIFRPNSDLYIFRQVLPQFL